MKRDPNDGGCWFCGKDDGEMIFSMEFDAWFHLDCLHKAVAENDPEAEIIAMEYSGKLEAKTGNEQDITNLYWVTANNVEYGVFVFARTAGRARYLAMQTAFQDFEYIEMRAYVKHSGIRCTEKVIEDTDDEGYELVTALGFAFADPEAEIIAREYNG